MESQCVCMRSACIHLDCEWSPDTNPGRATPTNRASEDKASLEARFVMHQSDTKVNNRGSAEDVDMSHARRSVFLLMSAACAIF